MSISVTHYWGAKEISSSLQFGVVFTKTKPNSTPFQMSVSKIATLTFLTRNEKLDLIILQNSDSRSSSCSRSVHQRHERIAATHELSSFPAILQEYADNLLKGQMIREMDFRPGLRGQVGLTKGQFFFIVVLCLCVKTKHVQG